MRKLRTLQTALVFLGLASASGVASAQGAPPAPPGPVAQPAPFQPAPSQPAPPPPSDPNAGAAAGAGVSGSFGTGGFSTSGGAYGNGTGFNDPNAVNGGGYGATGDAPASPEALAKFKDAGLHDMITLQGSTGLLRVASAESAPVGTFRIQALWEYFSANGFLCSSSATCPSKQSDHVSRFGTNLGVSATVASFLETYGSFRSYATNDNQGSPQLLQVLGDTTLGVKAFIPRPAYSLLHAGLDGQLLLLNGTGGLGVNGGSTSFRFRADGTVDFRKPEGGAPILLHLNLGYKFDNSGKIIQDTEAARGRPITRIERFGLGINRVDALEIGLGAEAELHTGELVRWTRLFAEYTIDVPTNRQGYTCAPQATFSGDNCLGNKATFGSTPSRLTLGVRANAFLRGLMAQAAVDIGTGGTKTFLEEVAPQQPWTLWLGLGYGFDTQPPTPIVQERVVEHVVNAAAPQFLIQGLVHEVGKVEGIPNAIIRFEGKDLNGIVTDSGGRFRTGNMDPGQYSFAVKADGFKDGTCTVVSAGQPATNAPPPVGAPPGTATAPASNSTIATVDCALEALPKLGKIVGHVVAAEGGAAVANAQVVFTDPAGKERTFTSDASGVFTIDQAPPGTSKIRVSQNDFLGATTTANVKAREDAQVTVSLNKRPKTSSVIVGKQELIIRQQVHFETNSATILSDSTVLLEEIADVLNKTPRIKLLEIQGHTDNTGSVTVNRQLSEARANAVRDRLIQNGVSSNRLTAKGYGAEQPLVPNVTAGNRAKNRRVALVIKDQDKDGPAAPPVRTKLARGLGK